MSHCACRSAFEVNILFLPKYLFDLPIAFGAAWRYNLHNNMSDKKRLFLLDAYALIFRGYYALIKNPTINSKGQDTSAIMGFLNSLFDVIRRERPDHLAVCFDKDGSAERTEMFADYKANRDETPDVIRQSIPIIQEIIKCVTFVKKIKTKQQI